jgi:hypothetical protein
MTVVIGVVVAALLFGVFTLLHPRDKDGCTGNCVGCSGRGACATDGVEHEIHS